MVPVLTVPMTSVPLVDFPNLVVTRTFSKGYALAGLRVGYLVADPSVVAVIERLRGAGKGKVADEGIKIACEQIEEFKEMKGVAGVHLMAIEWEHRVPEIAERAGVLPRPRM